VELRLHRFHPKQEQPPHADWQQKNDHGYGNQLLQRLQWSNEVRGDDKRFKRPQGYQSQAEDQRERSPKECRDPRPGAQLKQPDAGSNSQGNQSRWQYRDR